MKSFLKIATLLSFFTSLVSCNTIEPVPIDQNIKIAEIDAAVKEVYLSINVASPSSNKEMVLERNGQIVMKFSANKTDTAITDTGLTENTVYKYRAKLTEKGKVIGESSEVSVRTMQPTSHEFSWQTFAFGNAGAGSSSLYDVAIIDENNIWAVGEIYMKDSTGKPDPHAYNAAHWDGSKWELKRITVNFRGSQITPPLEGAFAFSSTDIWFVGSLPIHGDGQNWVMYDLRTTVDPNLSLSKTWGASTNDMYFVGRVGSIAHYKNGQWQKIESGTNADIQDIWGIEEGGKQTILCAVSNVLTSGENKILRINEGKIDQINWVSGRRAHSIWFNDQNNIFVSGGGVFIRKQQKWEEQTSLPLTYTRRIRGNGKNDVFVAGDFGMVGHYNGKNWKIYPEVAQGLYYSMDYKKKIMVAAGGSDKAIVLIMKKIR